MAAITVCITFPGTAEKAITHYIQSFPGSTIESLERYKSRNPNAKEYVKQAEIIVSGLSIYVHDLKTPPKRPSPPMLAVEFTDKEMFERAMETLPSSGGSTVMPLTTTTDGYERVKVKDPFGIYWTLDYAPGN